MQKNILKERKKLFLFLSLLLIFGLFLTGCNWFGEGILNVFDPQAQIRVDYRLDGLTAQGTADIWFTIFSLNEAEFIGEKFLFEYYVDGNKIHELTRTIGATFYVPPYPISSSENPISVPKEDCINCSGFPVYFQDVIDYMILNPMVLELDATITVMGTDGAGHAISKTIAFDLPAILPGIDFIDPEAKILTEPSPPTGNIPLTVTFDGSQSCDQRNNNSPCLKNGIKTFYWDLGDGTTSSSKIVTHNYDTPGIYVVTLTVTDYFDNQGIETVTVEAADASGPSAIITTLPAPPNVTVDQNITFDGSGSSVSGDCGCGTTIESYSWNFDDGDTGSGSIVNHSYDNIGTYNVTLTVTDSNGKSAVTSVVVNVT